MNDFRFITMYINIKTCNCLPWFISCNPTGCIAKRDFRKNLERENKYIFIFHSFAIPSATQHPLYAGWLVVIEINRVLYVRETIRSEFCWKDLPWWQTLGIYFRRICDFLCLNDIHTFARYHEREIIQVVFCLKNENIYTGDIT